ncbi:MAG: ribonuclease HI family protein [Caldilineaceae bacterium]
MWNTHSRRQSQPLWLFCDGSTGTPAPPQGQAPDGEPTVAGTPENIRTRLRPAMQCAAAAVAYRDDGAILDWSWQQLPPVTNNEAEYAGLILGLALAQRLRAQCAICVLDNAVVIGQMEGRFAVHNARMRRYYWEAQAAVRQLPCVRFCQVPREWNRLADGLAAQATLPWSVLKRALAERVGD